MRNLSDSFFGSIALKNGMLTRDELARALQVQWERTKEGSGPTLGEVCRELGLLTAENVSAILWAQARSEVMLEDTLAGRIAVRNRLVSPEQLEAALAEQRRRGGSTRICDILVERNLLSPQQVHAILTAQKRMKESGRLRPVIVPPARPKAAPLPTAPAPGKCPPGPEHPPATGTPAPKRKARTGRARKPRRGS